MISDCRGGFLDRLTKQTFVQRNIRFLYRSGRTSGQTAYFIESNSIYFFISMEEF